MMDMPQVLSHSGSEGVDMVEFCKGKGGVGAAQSARADPFSAGSARELGLVGVDGKDGQQLRGFCLAYIRARVVPVARKLGEILVLGEGSDRPAVELLEQSIKDSRVYKRGLRMRMD
ncbi:hypothetical protein PYH37_000796 [Sinorhizobium numidicum]|uniref:Uncharacterized protein n=1 Tax=Sinorhizobium numidicum TaxID=680248 RepID=A0ABY8CVN6_9HYPH|nr:hypothetical protein [Sinorhizobium numidicum]WEX75389.1 hypothetical protein PYH37_000796 [Sinorhizobium numidicum]WEX81385.1 hypothetical protein PYH38_000797 [Sinorhizobium numidicum]